MLCLSRVTDERYARRFGDGEHKFYFEIRCNQPCVAGKDICRKCEKIYPECKNQFCRYFPHGKVTEPIPDRSHMYGGKWYRDHLKEWGSPSDEMIRFAEQHRAAACQEVTLKEEKPCIKKEMPPRKKVIVEEEPVVVAAVAAVPSAVAPIVPKKPRVVKKKEPKEAPKEAPVSLVHKEVVLPTHKEDTAEEVDTEGYDIEYVKLSLFELDRTTYFRDRTKNKLYARIKDRIGEYVGRFDPDTESIDADIPDSDNEN